MAKPNAQEKLTRAALLLMLRQGYGATSVDEVCAEAGVSKGSFYHFFKTKEDVGLAALQQFVEDGAKKFQAGEFYTLEDPEKRLKGFLDHIEKVSTAQWREGCLLANFGVEMMEQEGKLRKAVQKRFKEFEKEYAVLFRPLAKEKGPSAEEMGRYFMDVIEGGILMSRATGDPNRIREAVKQFRYYLKQAV